MAFGRSNSLSINTSATNSLFDIQRSGPKEDTDTPLIDSYRHPSTDQANSTSSQQQTNQNAGPTQQPSAGGGTGLFGGQQQNQQQNQQQPASTSLFGAQEAQGTSSLFGGTPQNQQQQNTSSLFGGNQQQPTQTTGGSNMFGGNAQQQNAQNTAAGSLFGGSTMNRGTSLFGGNTGAAGNTGGTSLFGAQQNQQQQGTTSLFGGQQNQQQGPTSLFGGQQNQQQQQQQQTAPSLFGLTATQPGYSQPTLLGASQYRTSQYPAFAGRLTMGQQASTAAGGGAAGGTTGGAGAGTPGQGAVQINFDNMRSTTRFNDCIPDIQAGLEKMDAMIASQERFCRDIEAFIPRHGANVRSLIPDVELITEKVEAAEGNISMDAQGVESEKAVLAKDGKDGDRVRRVIDNLRQPREFHYSSFQARGAPAADSADGSVVRDMDLIGNYFVPLASSLQQTVNAYSINLTEIEQHLRVIEASAVAQAQQLAAKRSGVRTDSSQNGDETVRELADTLRGFEASILAAAGQVGQCREGLNGLVLGRLGGR